ncbi:hypothetical protein [Mucilaginibacter terrae]|uniref:Uncharacterized protein n=1 Tax=Mucilaginibacter terrae TaxID=1955052 RepID=A0ABU3GNG4_9SPHI|nr:hypothetical protein [Mucilaginibacter terrae]MDT3401329.1 hypothetical protein [Mucilaginibacter terrae]
MAKRRISISDLRFSIKLVIFKGQCQAVSKETTATYYLKGLTMPDD